MYIRAEGSVAQPDETAMARTDTKKEPGCCTGPRRDGLSAQVRVEVRSSCMAGPGTDCGKYRMEWVRRLAKSPAEYTTKCRLAGCDRDSLRERTSRDIGDRKIHIDLYTIADYFVRMTLRGKACIGVWG